MKERRKFHNLRLACKEEDLKLKNSMTKRVNYVRLVWTAHGHYSIHLVPNAVERKKPQDALLNKNQTRNTIIWPKRAVRLSCLLQWISRRSSFRYPSSNYRNLHTFRFVLTFFHRTVTSKPVPLFRSGPPQRGVVLCEDLSTQLQCCFIQVLTYYYSNRCKMATADSTGVLSSKFL